MRFLLLSLFCVTSCNWAAAPAPPSPCEDHRKHGRRDAATACFNNLVNTSKNPALIAEGFWGLKNYKAANELFRKAVAANPKDPHVRVRWGRMYLDHFQKVDAAGLFEEALELKENYAPAQLGLALVASESFEEKAVEMAKEALKNDPTLVEAQELLARLALEEGNELKAGEEAEKALKMTPEALDAMAVMATIHMLNDRDASEWTNRILKINPSYGQAWSIVAHFFVINRRYEEGIQMYYKALELDSGLLETKSDLGVNLMRLGRDVEARKLLEEAFAGGYTSAATVNTLKLMDSYKNFDTLLTPKTDIRLHKKETALLKLYFQPELERAIATYEAKYKFKLKEPVRLEVYPDHEDFAVRTMGLPGLGALGVTFGTVVAMDSPSGRKPGAFHWASTLWHELDHVYVLTATQHRVPRWFAEGMAMHEETANNPEWGDRFSVEGITAIRDKKLLPIATLDAGFVRPKYPAQVTVSYFQAGKICDYIKERWGFDKLLEMMNAFGAKQTTEQIVEQKLGMKPEQFDIEFLAWLNKQVGNTVTHFEEWRKRLKQSVALMKEKKYDEILKDGHEIRDLYPDYVEAGNMYEMMASSFLEKKDTESAIKELTAYAKIGGRDRDVLKKLGKLLEDKGNKQEAAAVYDRINYFYPMQDEELHRKLGDLWMDLKNAKGAVREFSAALGSKPVDPALAYYNLARAQKASGNKDDARESLVSALENAPGFKPAQKMLLELTDK